MRQLEQIKYWLANRRAFVLASEARWTLQQCVRELDQRAEARAVVRLKTDRPRRGRILLSYMIQPFLGLDAVQSNSHTRYAESLQMARTLLDLGYDVDVISWRNDLFRPAHPYAAMIDVRHNLQRLAPLVGPDCIKVFHIDTAHILFHNAAEAGRLLALQQRRGVSLRPRRFEWPNLGIEHADCGTTLGNEFTIATYRYARKPIHRLPIPSAFRHPWIASKDWDRCRSHFVFFSSGGLVHKGLDLALEAFAGLPDCHLTVCAPIDAEPDFKAAYARELYDLPNIHTVGWVDIGKPQFVEIATRCAAVLSPSCSEGGGGAVVTCLHAGLVPIVSAGSSVDIGHFGVPLKECSVPHIRETVRAVTEMSPHEVEVRSRQAWEYASANHTPERYAQRYRDVMTAILDGRA